MSLSCKNYFMLYYLKHYFLIIYVQNISGRKRVNWLNIFLKLIFINPFLESLKKGLCFGLRSVFVRVPYFCVPVRYSYNNASIVIIPIVPLDARSSGNSYLSREKRERMLRKVPFLQECYILMECRIWGDLSPRRLNRIKRTSFNDEIKWHSVSKKYTFYNFNYIRLV